MRFGVGARRLLTPYLDDAICAAVDGAFGDLSLSLTRSRIEESTGQLVARLGALQGLPESKAVELGELVDVLQVAADLADNLADAELDAAAGRPLEARYPGLHVATLLCVPALLIGVVFAELSRRFPAPTYAPDHAAERLGRVLAAMAVGQGLGMDDPRRVQLISGRQGHLLCLPTWLLGDAQAGGAERRVALERWAEAYGCLWQLRIDVDELGTAAARHRYEAALEAARAAWPAFAPFQPGEAFAVDALLAPRRRDVLC